MIADSTAVASVFAVGPLRDKLCWQECAIATPTGRLARKGPVFCTDSVLRRLVWLLRP